MKDSRKTWQKPEIKDYLLGLKNTEKHETTAESLFPIPQQPNHGNDS